MLSTIINKEMKQLLSDKGFLLIALIQPIIFIIMFGSSFENGDINHLDTIIIDQDNSEYSKYVIEATEDSEFFDIVPGNFDFEEAQDMLEKSKIRAIIFIPEKFQENIDNKITGELKVYIDSSNFLTFSSLSGAKIEILKDVLQKVTGNILDDLEIEKENGKAKIDEINVLLNEIDTEAESLDVDIMRLEENTADFDFSEMEDFVDELETSLDEQRDGLELTIQALDQVINTISNVHTTNSSEETSKLQAINQMNAMKTEFQNTRSDIAETLNELNDLDVPNSNDFDMDFKDKFDSIRELFESADSKSGEVNFDFEKLEKNFLSEPLKIEEIASQGEIRYFDYLGAGILSFIIFFVCLLAPALNIISEKEKNTLYRLSTTPASSLKIFIGKFSVFLAFGILESLYTLLLAVLIYDLRITGSFWNVMAILALLACASISLGLLISSIVKTMQQALVIVPVIVIPSFLISHSFFPPDIMPDFMNYVAYITPMTYSNHAFNAIMIKGFSLGSLMFDIVALLAFTIIPLIFFVWSLKRIKY